MAENLPTARSMLPQTYLCLWVKFRCAKCGSRMTDKVMMGRDGYSRGSRTTLSPPAALLGTCEVSGRGVRWIECYAAQAALLEGRGSTSCPTGAVDLFPNFGRHLSRLAGANRARFYIDETHGIVGDAPNGPFPLPPEAA